jgi:RNA polymerase sigma-70 factor (ECF subfamily)
MEARKTVLTGEEARDEVLADSLAVDERLVLRVRQGSGAAFAALVARYRDTVYRIARNMCSTSSDVEDAIRRTFVSAYRDIGSLQTGRRFRTWLCGIAMKKAQAGRKGVHPAPENWLEPLLPRFDQAGCLPAPAGEWPDLERVEVTGVLREALECIDDGVRAAFVLCDLAELPVDEVAVILEASSSAIRQRLHRARLLLRGFLDRLWISTAA